MKLALDSTHEISRLVIPCRGGLFETLKSQLAPDNPSICSLSPPKWTMRVDSLARILSDYSVLQQLSDEGIELVKDSETIARINIVLLR